MFLSVISLSPNITLIFNQIKHFINNVRKVLFSSFHFRPNWQRGGTNKERKKQICWESVLKQDYRKEARQNSIKTSRKTENMKSSFCFVMLLNAFWMLTYVITLRSQHLFLTCKPVRAKIVGTFTIPWCNLLLHFVNVVACCNFPCFIIAEQQYPAHSLYCNVTTPS